MQLNAKDIRAAMVEDSTLSGLFGSRVFWRECLSDPGADYVIFQREVLEGQRQVDEVDRLEFLLFSKDTLILEENLQKVREFFTGEAKIFNGQEYYNVVFLDIQDGAKISTGYYFSSIRFAFYKTT